MSERKTIALCIMTCTNEQTIGMALKSALALVDDIIIVDIGSRDNTRIIAEGYGARVIDFEFDGDYSKAKNAALKETSCEWILWLNPNEELAPARPVEFQKLLHANVVAYSLRIFNKNRTKTLDHLENIRMWRNHRDVRFEYPIREKIEFAIQRYQKHTSYNGITTADVGILSSDPLNSTLKPSPHTVAKVLKKMNAKDPHDPYMEYALACETIDIREGEVVPTHCFYTTLHMLEAAWRKTCALDKNVVAELGLVSDLMHKLVSFYLIDGQIQTAWDMACQARKLYPHNDSITMLYIAVGISYLREVVRDSNSRQYKSITKMLNDLNKGLMNTQIPKEFVFRYAGELALLENKVDRATGFFERIIEFNPQYSFAWLGLARCHLFQNDRLSAIRCCMQATKINSENHLAWMIGSQILESIGFHGNAKTWRQTVYKKFPLYRQSIAAQ